MKVSDLKVGSYLRLGRYPIRGADRAPAQLIWIKATSDNGFLLTRVLPAMFDALEAENPCEDIAHKGNPSFPASNVYQYLNSTERNWYKPQSGWDSVAESMTSRPGFLYALSEWELQAIVPHEIVSVFPSASDDTPGLLVRTSQKVSILSRSQVFGTGDQREGQQIELFATGLSTPETCTFTRTAIPPNVWCVDGTQGEGTCIPCLTFAVQPYIQVDGNYPVEIEERSGVCVLMPPQEIVDSIEENLNSLINKSV